MPLNTNGEIGKLYQDPLYGTKVLSPLAVAIIDTPEFQRLSELRQLGFADIVYRGARHSRFAHSVGTYFLTRTLMRRIVQNHERLRLDHPGQFVSESFRHYPENACVDRDQTTYQSRWRGLSEVVSAAALLHDIRHVPFGHTLEDEMAGIYKRHDSLAGPRLHELLFNTESDLTNVFSENIPRWVGNLSNTDLGRLIYVILNWKEKIDIRQGFESILKEELDPSNKGKPNFGRLSLLVQWYSNFKGRNLFHPFMSDIIGNTICADLLDYLPRDRQNLGMEPRLHARLQRYFTIRMGTLYPDEGLRISIMVTRKGRGGQRRDVATAVLDIMRERYEMAERVFYHHKKAAASAALAKLVELAGAGKPRDDEKIYPAPWSENAPQIGRPHMTHLSDGELIDYLGSVKLECEKATAVQKRLHAALRFRRKWLHRTLLVIDSAVPNESKHPISYLATEFRGTKEDPTNQGRLKLESKLVQACGADEGDVLIYCPDPDMQSKEVDARLEIVEDRILPLRCQTESFAYQRDINVLKQYYDELWRAYVFVSPGVFADVDKCKLIVDSISEHFGIPQEVLYRKVRRHELQVQAGRTPSKAIPAVADGERADGRLAQLHGALVVSLSDEPSADDMSKINAWAGPRLHGLSPEVFTKFLKALPGKQLHNRPGAPGAINYNLISVLERALQHAQPPIRAGKRKAAGEPSLPLEEPPPDKGPERG